ncbi:STE-like pheromone receptor [Rhizoctonia solani AG-3 Rhs1AP]|nr:STE-like pheromone receptor [Rhizoctonia solani AG-3 Rhs1AP]
MSGDEFGCVFVQMCKQVTTNSLRASEWGPEVLFQTGHSLNQSLRVFVPLSVNLGLIHTARPGISRWPSREASLPHTDLPSRVRSLPPTMRTDLPVVSFLCTALVLIPLPWHWRARNTATLSIIFWLGVINFTRGINSIVWAGKTINYAPVWCDITAKLIIGANWAFPSSTLCICRYLAQVSSPHHKIANASDKRRRMYFEIFMCAVLPIIAMALHYVVQGHRFDILEDFGCNPTTYVSVAALFIVYLPPLVLSLITLVYAGIALRWFVHRRAQFQAVLQSSNSGLTTGRYLRLIALSITEMLFATATTLFVLVITLEDNGLRPWVSWDFVHSDWLRVDQFAKVLAPQYFWDRYLLTWYMVPITSVIFFAFFGFGQEAKAEYARYFNFVKTKIFRIKNKPQPVLPVSARGGINTMSSTLSTPAVIKLHTETTVSRTSEKWDDAPASSVHSASRPPSPSGNNAKDTLDVDVESRQ